MKDKVITIGLSLIVLALVCVFAVAQKTGSQQKPKPTSEANYKPAHGYVPDAETAIAIAVAVWNPIYGKKKISGEKPYNASLKDGVWTVTGSLAKGVDGGTAIAEISKEDGRILRVIHGK